MQVREPRWLTNVPADKLDEFKGRTVYRVFAAEPAATPSHSASELESMGMLGVYTYDQPRDMPRSGVPADH